jgi:hypothetical protein
MREKRKKVPVATVVTAKALIKANEAEVGRYTI